MSQAWNSPRYGRIRGGRPAPPPAPALRVVDEHWFDPRLAQAPEPETSVRVGPLRVDFDGVFAFLIFVPLLFVAQWGTLSAAAVAALTPIYGFVRRDRLLRTMAPRAFLFLLPALALLSVLWSLAPRETFKAAVGLGLTITAGLLLCSARNQAAVIKGLAVAFFVYIAAAVAFGGSVAVGVGAGGYAFSGLSGSKNLLGDIASTGAIISIATVMLGVRRRQPIWILGGLLAIGLSLYVVLAARSAGALLGLGMGAGAMCALALLLLVGRGVRAWLTSTVALCLIAAGLSYRWLTQTLIDLGARTFDKDPTLTGRTYLWYRADDLIQERPVLGRGYDAFWVQGNIDAEGLWRYFGIDHRGGFTFHNTAVELLVTLGWVGLILTALITIVGAVFLIRKFVLRPSIALVCWMSLLLYQLARTPIETIGVSPFYFSTALAFAALGAGFGRVHLARQAMPYAPPRPAATARGGGVLRLRREAPFP